LPSAGLRVTIFCCEPDEEAVFREKSPDYGIEPVITALPVNESTIPLAVGSSSISVGHKTPITNAHLEALSELGVRYISTRSIGYNHIDVAYAQSLGMTVKNVAYSPDAVADHTLMLMLMALRQAKAVVLSANEHDYRLTPNRGRELRDLTVGVVGTGRIGSAVIDRLSGFGCEVLANDSRQTTSAHYVSLDELLHRSDIVTLHMPLDESTHHLLDARAFESMRDSAYVVNTGRGSLIDSAALLDALESGKLSGAALDVVEGEEHFFYADHRGQAIENSTFTRLHAMPNVVITPHNAFYTDHALNDTVVNSLVNCLKFEKGASHV